jgi:hypothetical protein
MHDSFRGEGFVFRMHAAGHPKAILDDRRAEAAGGQRREAHEGSEGLVEHHMHVGEALNRLFSEAADNAVTIYGDASPQLVEIANDRKDVDATCYSFLRGLEA